MVCAQIFLIGAEFTHANGEIHGGPTRRRSAADRERLQQGNTVLAKGGRQPAIEAERP
jgi:hypothetical protein